MAEITTPDVLPAAPAPQQAHSDAQLVEIPSIWSRPPYGHASITTTGRYLHARPHDSSSRFLAL